MFFYYYFLNQSWQAKVENCPKLLISTDSSTDFIKSLTTSLLIKTIQDSSKWLRAFIVNFWTNMLNQQRTKWMSFIHELKTKIHQREMFWVRILSLLSFFLFVSNLTIIINLFSKIRCFLNKKSLFFSVLHIFFIIHMGKLWIILFTIN
jgi:hypothetical protein